MKFTAALLMFSLVITAASINTPLQQARDLYYQGTYGDRSAASKSDKLFSQLFTREPQNDLVKAYYGSERLLEASHTWALWKKYSLSKQGIQLMDAAVANAPNDLEVRFVRAVTTYNLPSFFRRREQSEDDFSYLSTRVSNAAKKGTLDSSIAATALLFYGRICKARERHDQAAAAWRSAQNIAPLSKAGKDATSELRRSQS